MSNQRDSSRPISSFPLWIDPAVAAREGRQFAGSLPLSQLPRSFERLTEEGQSDSNNANSELSFELSFDHDVHSRPLVRSSVSGDLQLICQRSLQAFEYHLQSSSQVVLVLDSLVEDISAKDELPDAQEPVAWNGEKIRLADLVDEEVLMALPLVPINPAAPALKLSAATEAAMEQEQIEAGPFASLKSMKKKLN